MLQGEGEKDKDKDKETEGGDNKRERAVDAATSAKRMRGKKTTADPEPAQASQPLKKQLPAMEKVYSDLRASGKLL